jgi:hypothetical protein
MRTNLLMRGEPDTTPDLPHQQNEHARPCRGCTRPTTRAHAVCSACTDHQSGFGCCARCAAVALAAL